MIQPYYQDELATIYHGDCLAVMDALKPALAGEVGMLLADPPYGIGVLPWDRPVDWPAFFAAHRGLCRKNAAKVFFCNIPCAAALYGANRKEYRYDLVWDVVNASGFLNAKRMPMRGHQNVLVFYQALPVYHPQRHIPHRLHAPIVCKSHFSENYGHIAAEDWKDDGTRYPSSIFSVPGPKNYGDARGNQHPTEKPVAS